MTSSLIRLFKRTPAPAVASTEGPVVQHWAELEYATSADRSANIGLWALALGFGGFMLWATLAPLDEGVPSPGSVVIDTKRKPVQHLTGGIVREVLVREGDIVKEGQVLVRLDDALTRSNFENLRQQYLGMRAMQNRLEAENHEASSIAFHKDILAEQADPMVQQLMHSQSQLLASRQEALRADLQALEESIKGQRATLQAYESNVINRRSQLTLLMTELGDVRSLVKDGFVPRTRQSELERMVAEANTALTDLLGNITRMQRSIAETAQRVLARKNEYKKEVEFQLTETTREAQANALRLQVAREELSRIELKAPVAGQVMGLAIQTPGSVLQSGQKILDVVPANETLLLEAHVAPNLIDQVRPGLPVDVRFSAFAHSPQLVVQGKVASVSNDLNTDPQGSSYYLARVELTPQGRKTLGNRQMQPGMPVEVVFKTGERTLLDYILHPLTKRMAAAMKEE